MKNLFKDMDIKHVNNQPITNKKTLIASINMVVMITRNNVVDSNYYMLLGRPWLRDAKVFHATCLQFKEIILS
jgi:hypothetical protein